VQQGKLTLRLNEEEVVFKVFDSLKHPSAFDTCHTISAIENLCSLNCSVLQEKFMTDELERLLVFGEKLSDISEDLT